MDAVDPSVRLTAIAEQIERTAERQRRRDPWRDRAMFAVLAIVISTCTLVGYSVWMQNNNSRSDQVTACRSALAADTQVGVALAIASLSNASLGEGEVFNAELRRTADDLLERAERYQRGAEMSGTDVESFLEGCR